LKTSLTGASTVISLLNGSINSARRLPKSQVIIRRPVVQLKSHPRAHISDDIIEEPRVDVQGRGETLGSSVDATSSSSQHAISEEPPDELARVRALLKPPPIPGVADWGIPGPPTEPCNPATVVRTPPLLQIHIP